MVRLAEKLELPQYKVNQKKAELSGAIKGWNRWSSDQLYAKTIRLINEPAGLMAAMVLDEQIRLRRRLNRLILLARTLHIVAVGAAIAALILWSYLPLLLTIGLELVWYFVISFRQTATNIEFGATTEVFCETMVSEPEFRSRAIEVVRRKYGDEAAANFASLFSISE